MGEMHARAASACGLHAFILSVLQMQGMALICMSRPASDHLKIETQSDWGYSLGVGEWKGATGHITGKTVRPLSEDA